MIAEVLPPEAPLPPGSDALENEVTVLEARVAGLQLLTPQDHDLACQLEREVMAGHKKAKELTEPAVAAGLAAHRAALKVQKFFCDPLENASRLLKQKIGAWRAEQKRLAEEEAMRVRLLAEKLAEDEKVERAARLENQGRAAEAAAILNSPVLAPVVAAAKPEAHGVAVRESWSAEVEDLAALIAWVAQDAATRSVFLLPAMPALNAQARSYRRALNIPGVKPASRFA